jgi:hypothetical protein
MDMKVLKKQCATCPFRPYSKTAFLAPSIALSALTEASRICHCTGCDNAFHQRTGKRPALCRGARDLQIQIFYRLGVLKEPTDKGWADAWAKLKKL